MKRQRTKLWASTETRGYPPSNTIILLFMAGTDIPLSIGKDGIYRIYLSNSSKGHLLGSISTGSVLFKKLWLK